LKIISIEDIPYDLPIIRPHKLAMATITEHTLVLVPIPDDEGREGLGEVAIIPQANLRCGVTPRPPLKAFE
jgi:muconate cycloisomerase